VKIAEAPTRQPFLSAFTNCTLHGVDSAHSLHLWY
jgi:hypothetical protein